MRFSPSGDTIATAGADGIARLWNASDGQPRCATVASDGDLTSLVFSHDGASLLTLDVQGDTRIWSTQTCQEQTQLIGQLSRVVSADFSPDDQYVVTAGSRPHRAHLLAARRHAAGNAARAYRGAAERRVQPRRDEGRHAPPSDGTSRVWDARIDRPAQSLGTHAGAASAPSRSRPTARRSRASGPTATSGSGACRRASRSQRSPSASPLDDVAFRRRRQARRRRGRGRDDPRLERRHPHARHASSRSPDLYARWRCRPTARGSPRPAPTTWPACSR